MAAQSVNMVFNLLKKNWCFPFIISHFRRVLQLTQSSTLLIGLEEALPVSCVVKTHSTGKLNRGIHFILGVKLPFTLVDKMLKNLTAVSSTAIPINTAL
jgi:hypothetical protein